MDDDYDFRCVNESEKIEEIKRIAKHILDKADEYRKDEVIIVQIETYALQLFAINLLKVCND